MESSSFFGIDDLDFKPVKPATLPPPAPLSSSTQAAIRRMAYTAENVTPVKVERRPASVLIVGTSQPVNVKVETFSAPKLKRGRKPKDPEGPRKKGRPRNSQPIASATAPPVKDKRRSTASRVEEGSDALEGGDDISVAGPSRPSVDPSIPLASGKSAVASRAYTYQPVPRRSRLYETALLEPHELPSVSTPIDNHWLYIFFRFCAERHRMQDKRTYEGVARDQLSTDQTMCKEFVGNVYRELDAGSIKMKGEIIKEGEQTVEEVCFRVFLFCGFYEYKTWCAFKDGLGHVPTWKDFEAELPKYEEILHRRSVIEREVIYTSAFQLVPPTSLFKTSSSTLPNYAATLRWVMSIMKMGVPAKLQACRYAMDASAILRAIPTLGGFLSLNILCYLNDTRWFQWQYRDFASCGPGSRRYLQTIFGPRVINNTAMEEAGLKWLYDNQWRYWKRIGADPPHAWEIGVRPGMRVLDFENALCWCHRYVHAYLKNGYGSVADRPHPAPPTDGSAEGPDDWDAASQPAWCEEEKWLNHVSRARLVGDYDEKLLRVKRIKEEAEAEAGPKGEVEVQRAIAAAQAASSGVSTAADELPTAGPSMLPTAASAAAANGTGGRADSSDDEDEGEEYAKGGVYEIERIIMRLGNNRADRDGLFRVRWKGYMPEDDTWERQWSLQETAADALQEYLGWEDSVWETIEKVKKAYPFASPAGNERKRATESGQEGRGKRARKAVTRG